MGIISQKLRDSAKGQVCTFQIPGICNYSPETTSLCHAPSEVKGMGNKSHDFHAAFGCSDCHTAIDQHRLTADEALHYWFRAVMRTQAFWVSKGLIVIAGDTGKTRPKRKNKWPSKTLQSRGFAKPHHGERHDD
jgi:hypothetical protein